MAYEGTLLAASITTGAAPSSDIITFPTHEDVYGKGGMMCVTTFAALTSIPVDRQKVGMMVYVADSNTYYRIHTIGAPLVGVTGSFSLSSLDLSNGLTVTGNISGNNLRTSFNQGSATGDYSFAVNRGKAFGSFSHAEGFATAFGNSSHAEGISTKAVAGFGSHSEGSATLASGNSSHAEGLYGSATGSYSHVEGYETVTGEKIAFLTYTASTRLFTFSNSLSSKFNNFVTPGTVLRAKDIALNFYRDFIVASRNSINGAISATSDVFPGDVANGFIVTVGNIVAFGAHAEGYLTTASGNFGSHAEGNSTTASGEASHAEGIYTIASGDYSHAEGASTIASGNCSHAQGLFCRSQAEGSFTTGWSNNVTLNSEYGIALGNNSRCDHARSYIWSAGSFGTANSENSYTTRAQQYMVNAPVGGIALYGNVGVGTDSIENALTVVGDVSASGTLYGKAQDLVLDATSTNTIANSAITAALQLLSPAPVYTAPTASLTTFSPSVFEVGQTVSQTLTLDWTQNDAGRRGFWRLTKDGVTAVQGTALFPQTFNVSEPATLSTTTYQLSVNFGTGVVKNNVLGFPDTRGQITANAVTINRSYTGYYRRWIGSDSTFPTSPASIRSLGLTTTLDTTNTLASQASPIYIDSKFILIAIPNTKSLVSVITEANENLTSQFNLSSIQIPDAGSTLRDYKLYYLETALPLNANLTTVTIA